MCQLRPALAERGFTLRCPETHTRDGYTLYGLSMVIRVSGDTCVGKLGIRQLVDLLHGPHLYIDDLVVAEGARANGLGAALLRFAEDPPPFLPLPRTQTPD